MRSIFSMLLTAALLLSALTACSQKSGKNTTAETRVTPVVTTKATPRPAATATPKPIDDGSDGSAVNDAIQDAGRAVGDVVGGAGNAVGSAVNGVGDAIDDAANGIRDGKSGNRTASTAVPNTPKR